MPDYAALLETIEAACQRGAARALEMRATMANEIKPDGSIVTDADREIETMLRETIAGLTPGAAVWGEEHGYQAPNEHGFWMIDPIDGTSNFRFGQPLWGVTAAYFHDGALQLGAICLPELGWNLTGLRGGGAYLNEKQLPRISPGAIEPFELVGHGDINAAKKYGYPGKIRHIGSFVVESALFVTGGLRALVTDKVCLYDAAAGIVMAREVGADVRELTGADWDENEWTNTSTCRPFGFFPPESGWPFQSQ